MNSTNSLAIQIGVEQKLQNTVLPTDDEKIISRSVDARPLASDVSFSNDQLT